MRKDPNRLTTRREFLWEGLRTLVGAGLGGLFSRMEAEENPEEFKPRPLHHLIACETYSLRDLLWKKQLTLETLPPVLKDLEIKGITLNDLFFASWEHEYLEELREAIQKSGLVVTGFVMEGNLATSDEKALHRQIEENTMKLEAAALLGTPVVRMNVGGTGDPEEDDTAGVQRVIAALNSLLPLAKRHGIRITIENHGGVSRKAENILAIIKSLDPKWVGSCLDFGNWHEETRYENCQKLAPHAYHVHAKAYAFDERGEETSIDYNRVLGYLKTANYKGALSIEFEGEGDPIEGVRKTRDLIRRHWKGI